MMKIEVSLLISSKAILGWVKVGQVYVAIRKTGEHYARVPAHSTARNPNRLAPMRNELRRLS